MIRSERLDKTAGGHRSLDVGDCSVRSGSYTLVVVILIAQLQRRQASPVSLLL